jgi:hypothetical protein
MVLANFLCLVSHAKPAQKFTHGADDHEAIAAQNNSFSPSQMKLVSEVLLNPISWHENSKVVRMTKKIQE